MDKIDYDYNDFFINVSDDFKDLVSTVDEMVRQASFINIKVTSSKTDPFKVAYSQPKTRRGIVNFYLRKRSFKMAVFAKNCSKYPSVINGLPAGMVNKLDKASNCQHLLNPGSCMEKCSGYDFYIGEKHYQKCRFGSFQFDVDAESVPFLLKMLESELAERGAESV
ncbi:MAG: hypothetical protein FWE21_01770 [Defluviitaleaceae bacterium]|nr:hypothetical protein [Defluviitaleaceae bacterium]